MAVDKEFEYIAALQDFSKSLKYLVDSIKEQVERNSATFKDSIGNSKEEAKNMAESAKHLELVAANTEKTKSNTDQILDIVKGIKQEKKSGIWDKLTNAKDKTKSMAEGIKTIALMAGGILAIGMAFKVIGDVNFASVLTLAVALPLVAMAFNEVGENIKSPKESALIAFSMIMMSVGITGAGLVLQHMPAIPLMQLMSAVGVSVALSAAMLGLSYAADKLGTKGILSLAGIALVIPLIAAGIAGAGLVLQHMPAVGFKEVVSAGMVGIAMGIATIPLAFAAKLLDGNTEAMLELTFMMPVIAGAIYASALILQHVPEINFINTLKTTLGITGAAFIFGLGIWSFDKLGINLGMAIKGSLAMIAVAGGIMASSLLIAQGNYTNAPSLEWALHAGVALLGGGVLAFAMGMFISEIIPGVAGMVAVAGGIMASSLILALGNYSNAPSLEWAEGVGLSLGAFGLAAIALGTAIMTGVGAVALLAGVAGIAGIAACIVATAAILGTGTFTGGPTLEWAKAVGMSMGSFGIAAIGLGAVMLTGVGAVALGVGLGAMTGIANGLVEISNIISKGNYTSGPTPAWASGTGMALKAFTDAVSAISPSGWDLIGGTSMDEKIAAITKIGSALPMLGNLISAGTYTNSPSVTWVSGMMKFMEGFSKLDMVDDAEDAAKQIKLLASSYMTLAGSINVLGTSLQSIKTAPDLTGIYGGLVTLSLIDSDKLEDTLDTLDSKKSEFKNVLSMIQAQSSVKIDESTFAFNKDNNSKSSASNSSTQTGTSFKSALNNIAPVKAQPKTIAPVVKPDRQEMLLSSLVQLMGQMNSVLNEIADNTSEKIHGSDIITN